jgi:hypothetical protein
LQVDECSVLRSIKKLFLNDYRNAVVVTAVDRSARIIKTDPANTWWRSKVKIKKILFVCWYPSPHRSGVDGT